MMDKLAVEAGDVDARVAVMAQDLSGYYQYAQIAEVLTDAGRPDEALVWAEKGLAATDLLGDHRDYDSRLDDFAVRAYLDRDRVDDALALVWRRFEARPDVSAYLRLRDWAGTVGVWDQWRTRARAHLRDDAARRAATPRSPAAAAASVRWRQPAPPSPYETLIAVLAVDGDLDEAWALATEHGCSRHQWRELADARRATHPRDAISVYEREVDELLAARTNRSYPDAITRLATIRDLHHQAGDPDAFTAYLARIRHEHRTKTKLIRLLDEAGLKGLP